MQPGGAVRSIAVKFLAEVGNYVQGLGRMKAATGDLITELSKSEQQRQNFQRLGTTMAVAGAGIAAGIGLATKAAIDWESAWAGVVKTVDGTEAELALLEDELREMARTLPATHGEIAAVAEAAGQLGVATEDISSFTRVMIDLGEATNLTADEAATSIAQLMNVMGTAPDQVDELGAALVELGNNGASTEVQIVQMAQRIAGAGAIVGATEADVLALANALASAGIRVEAGGSAISRVLVSIASSASEGGEKIAAFAAVAGQSADEFADHFRTDPVAALNEFVLGLGRMNDAGENVFGTLDQLGLSEVRTRDALLRLAASGDLLTQSLEDGERAWDENIALAAEAERRYGTTAAQLSIARNQVNDLAISMGETFLPVVGDAAAVVGNLSDVIGGLPTPLKVAAGVLATLVAGVTLLSGATLILVPRIAATKAALDQLAASGGATAATAVRLRGAMSFLMGPWGVAIAAAVGLATAAFSAWSVSQAQAQAEAREIADTLDDLTGGFTDATRALVAHKLEEGGALEAAQRLGLGLADLTDIVLDGEGDFDRLNDAIERATDGELRFSESGHFAQGATSDLAFDAIRLHSVLEELNPEIAEGVAQWQRTSEAQEGAAGAASRLDPATRDLADSFGVAAGAAGDVADAVDDLDEELEQLFDRVFSLQDAQDDLADAFDALTDQINEQREAGVEGAGSFKGMTEAARENRDLARELLEAYGAVALETIRMSGSNDEATAAAEAFQAKLDELEEQTGINVRELEGYNEVVDEVDRLIAVTFDTEGVQAAIRAAELFKERLDAIDRTVRVSFETTGFAPVGSIRIAERHGGIVAAQHGLITSSPTVLFGERGTGLEAFIPRDGITSQRGLELADTAARWHGGRVVAGDGASVGGPFQWHGQRAASTGAATAAALPDHFTASAVLDLGEGIERAVEIKFQRHDQALLGRLEQGVGAAL